jgi:hypothetical protein
MEKFKATLSHSARDVYCSAVCNRLAIAKALVFNIAGTPATGFECASHEENRSDK